MGKSSIHIRAVSSGSERHNKREKELNYVRKDLQHLNSWFSVGSIAERRRFIEQNTKQKTGRKIQAKAVPIREGVLLIDKSHTADLKKLAEKIEERFGIKTIQGYCHKDEGHYDKITKEWKPNYHAHMIFDWTDHATGKSIKMGREEMSELQSLVAEELGLERGQKSSKRHIESTKFKAIKEEEDLAKVYKVKQILPMREVRKELALATLSAERTAEHFKQQESQKGYEAALGFASVKAMKIYGFSILGLVVSLMVLSYFYGRVSEKIEVANRHLEIIDNQVNIWITENPKDSRSFVKEVDYKLLTREF